MGPECNEPGCLAPSSCEEVGVCVRTTSKASITSKISDGRPPDPPWCTTCDKPKVAGKLSSRSCQCPREASPAATPVSEEFYIYEIDYDGVGGGDYRVRPVDVVASLDVWLASGPPAGRYEVTRGAGPVERGKSLFLKVI